MTDDEIDKRDRERAAFVRMLELRAERWATALGKLRELGIAHEQRVSLVLWRSGHGMNSLMIDVLSYQPKLSEALWSLNPDYRAIMAAEGARVSVPAPVPPSLGRTIYSGIDTAGLQIWDGFFDLERDSWSGVMTPGLVVARPYGCGIYGSESVLRLAIDEEKRKLNASG